MHRNDFQPRVLDPEFEILELLGRGGAASVVRARQRSLGRDVALKILPAELSANQRKPFFREATRLASLDHPNIVKVFDFGVIGASRPCLVLQYVPGRDLGAILAKTRRLALSRILPLVCQACDALAYTHTRGIIHRDIKPQNILIGDLDTRTEHVLVGDFGIARDTSQRVSTSVIGMVSGTPAWMSPEQGEGLAASPTSDIYSLALVLYTALTGANPFRRADAVATINAHHGPRPAAVADVRASVPEALSRVIMSALAIEPSHRPQSAIAFRDRLLAAVPAGESTRDSDITLDAVVRPSRRITGMAAIRPEQGDDTLPDRHEPAATPNATPAPRPKGLFRRVPRGIQRTQTSVLDVVSVLPPLSFLDHLRIELRRIAHKGGLPWGLYLPTVMSTLTRWRPAEDGAGPHVRLMTRLWARQLDFGRGEASCTTLVFREHRLDGLQIAFDTTASRSALSEQVTARLGVHPEVGTSATIWRTAVDVWTLTTVERDHDTRRATLQVTQAA